MRRRMGTSAATGTNASASPVVAEPRRRANAGATLVEVIVACVILMVMAIAGATSLYLSRGSINVQRNKRLAVEIANSRLELLRGTNYWSITNLFGVTDYSVHYLSRVGATWQRSVTDPGEKVAVGPLSMPITTTAQYQDMDGGSSSYDCLRLTVTVGYRLNPPERVTLETLWAP